VGDKNEGPRGYRELIVFDYGEFVLGQFPDRLFRNYSAEISCLHGFEQQ